MIIVYFFYICVSQQNYKVEYSSQDSLLYEMSHIRVLH